MEQQASNCSRYHSRHRGMLFVQPVLCHNCGNCAQVAKAERHCDLCMPAVGNMARGETTLTTRTVRMYYPPPLVTLPSLIMQRRQVHAGSNHDAREVEHHSAIKLTLLCCSLEKALPWKVCPAPVFKPGSVNHFLPSGARVASVEGRPPEATAVVRCPVFLALYSCTWSSPTFGRALLLLPATSASGE